MQFLTADILRGFPEIAAQTLRRCARAEGPACSKTDKSTIRCPSKRPVVARGYLTTIRLQRAPSCSCIAYGPWHVPGATQYRRKEPQKYAPRRGKNVVLF